MKKVLFFLVVLTLCACKKDEPTSPTDNLKEESSGSFSGGSTTDVTETGSTDLATFDIAFSSVPLTGEPSDMSVLPGDGGDFIENWDAYTNNDLTVISLTWQNDKVVVEDGSAGKVSVSVSGTDVTIVSTKKKINYILSGTSSDGSLKIYSDNKFVLTFNGLNLTNPAGPAINIQKGKTQEEDGGYPHKTVFVQLVEGTTNTLADGSGYSTSLGDEDQKACFFSEGQLIFNGKGALTVTGNNKHAICSDDYVRIRPGVNLTVYANGEDGIKGNEYVIVGGGLMNIQVNATAGKGIKSDTVLIAGGRTTVLTSGGGMYSAEDKDVSASAGVKAGYLTIQSGELNCKSTGQGGKGISVDYDMVVNGGLTQIITTGGVYTYSRDLDSKPKGIKVDNNLTINDGQLKVRCNGAQEGSEGIEAKNTITINGGLVESYCTDDAMNAANKITINGGYIYAYASNNDGLDSNGTIAITGGVLVASGTNVPEEGIDCDQNNFSVTGGCFIGIGGNTSTPTDNSCTQPCLIYGGSCSQGALISVLDADSNLVLSFVSDRTWQQMTLLTSSPNFQQGASYTIVSSGTLTGGTSFHGLNTTGTITGTTSVSSATLSSMVTTIGNIGGMGGGGDQPGGDKPGGGGQPGGGGPGGNPPDGGFR